MNTLNTFRNDNKNIPCQTCQMKLKSFLGKLKKKLCPKKYLLEKKS